MLSLILSIIPAIAFTSTATPTNRTVDCEFDVYQHPNASSSYSIAAIVSNESTIMNSTTETWQIVNSIGNVSDLSNVVNPQVETLAQDVFLDTSSTINASSLSSPLPFAGCSFTFGLPSGDHIGKTSADGSCGKIFGQSCLHNLMQLAQDITAGIPTIASTKLIDACDTVSEALNNYITASSEACSKDGPSIEISQGLNFSYADTDSCTNPPTTLPVSLFQRTAPVQQGNYTLYDQWTKTTTPILLALFSNTTLNGAGVSFAQTYFTCTSPMNVTAGSHDPTSAADHAAAVDVKSVVGFALAINALVFLML